VNIQMVEGKINLYTKYESVLLLIKFEGYLTYL
jgi:hypothetical protein